MSNEYISDCGCVIHVIKLTTKAKMLTVKQCPLHKAAPELLAAAKEAILQITYLHAKFQETGSGVAVISKLWAAITKADLTVEVPFSFDAVIAGYWEFYHDDSCDAVLDPDTKICAACGRRPDMQSMGARRIKKEAV